MFWGGFNWALELTNTESFCISCTSPTVLNPAELQRSVVWQLGRRVDQLFFFVSHFLRRSTLTEFRRSFEQEPLANSLLFGRRRGVYQAMFRLRRPADGVLGETGKQQGRRRMHRPERPSPSLCNSWTGTAAV
jgi:hypothetical protein